MEQRWGNIGWIFPNNFQPPPVHFPWIPAFPRNLVSPTNPSVSFASSMDRNTEPRISLIARKESLLKTHDIPIYIYIGTPAIAKARVERRLITCTWIWRRWNAIGGGWLRRRLKEEEKERENKANTRPGCSRKGRKRFAWSLSSPFLCIRTYRRIYTNLTYIQRKRANERKRRRGGWGRE